MRRLLLLTLGILVSFSAFAQYNPTPALKIDWNGINVPDHTIIGISFEIENADLGGYSYEYRCVIDPELKTDFEDTVERCVEEANDVSKDYGYPVYFTNGIEEKEYYIIFNVKSVTPNGHVYADAKFITPAGIATFTNLSGNGGAYGTFVNLMGDGFQSLGKDIAKRIIKAKRKGKI